MATQYTSLLGLALPVTGELNGTWGDTVNDAITSLLDSAVAGTTTLSTDADVTLSTTTGAANQARQAILLCSGARTAQRNITAPAQSKIYTVINNTTGGFAVVLRGAGPTTGVSIPAGKAIQVVWNGSDFVELSPNSITGNLVVGGTLGVTGATTLTGALTAKGAVTLGDAAGDAITINGTTTFANTNPTLSAGTANGVAYLNGSKVLTTGSALTFDGTNLGVGTSSPVSSANSNILTINGTNASQIYLQSGGTSRAAIYATNAEFSLFGVGDRPMRFFTNDTERMRLDSSGNLGLGVTPSAWFASYKALQLAGGAYITFSNMYGQIGANSYLNTSGVNTYISNGFATQYDQAGGAHVWKTAPSGTAGNAISFTQAMTLTAAGDLLLGRNNVDGPIFGSENAVPLRLGTGNSERVRINSSGGLWAGVTSVVNVSGIDARNALSTEGSEWAAAVRNASTSPWGLAVRYPSASPNTTSNAFYWATDSTATRFLVYSNGGVWNYQANNSNLSDRREKTNFAPAKNYLDTICAIPVQTFNYIDQNLEDDPGLTLGVVAQDVQAVAPELVTESNVGTPDDPKMRLSIYQTDLQYALMKCIQELNAKVEALEARLASDGPSSGAQA